MIRVNSLLAIPWIVGPPPIPGATLITATGDRIDLGPCSDPAEALAAAIAHHQQRYTLQTAICNPARDCLCTAGIVGHD